MLRNSCTDPYLFPAYFDEKKFGPVLVKLITTLQEVTSFSLDRFDPLEKRAYSDPDDPRNLFAAMYGGVYKRAGAGLSLP